MKPAILPRPERRGLTRVWVKHYGRIYACLASFPDTDEGREQANAFMQANPGASLLCVENGRAYLAHESDKGIEDTSLECETDRSCA